MSRNTNSSSQTFNIKNATDVLTLEFENTILITESETFVPPSAATAVRFTAVGGGSASVGAVSGAGAGLFQKTFYAPWTGDFASFQLTIAAAEGTTILANNSGTSIARAFGATEISGPNPNGVGGCACGGDLNTSGSPGGSSPGRGGASGGTITDSVYDDTYAGRWKYFQESIRNENIKNYIISNFYLSGGSESVIGIGTDKVAFQEINGQSVGGIPAGLFSKGFDACSNPSSPMFTNCSGQGGKGGYGGDGGRGADGRNFLPNCPGYLAGCGGDGGYGGDGGCGGGLGCYSPSGSSRGTAGYRGGNGGYGGNGGQGRTGNGSQSWPGTGGNGGDGGFGGYGGDGGLGSHPCGLPYRQGGCGGKGGFGGGGGRGAEQGYGGCGGYGGGGGVGGRGPGPAGPGAVIVEWTTKEIIN